MPGFRWLTKPWSLQYASNLYANRGWRPAWSALVPGAGNALALLGGCGSAATAAEAEETHEFLKRCSATWETVFYVPGPLELASAPEVRLPFPTQEDAMVELAASAAAGRENIVWMNQGEWEDSTRGIVLLGATGWTEAAGLDAVPRGTEEGERLWSGGAEGVERVGLEQLREWHTEDMEWLTERLEWWGRRAPGRQVVALTHHLCSGRLLSFDLPRAAYKRMALDVMSVESTHRAFHARNLYAWLCGATGSCVSGYMGTQKGVFTSANSLHPCPTLAHPSPNYLPDRRLEFSDGLRGDAAGSGGGGGLLGLVNRQLKLKPAGPSLIPPPVPV